MWNQQHVEIMVNFTVANFTVAGWATLGLLMFPEGVRAPLVAICSLCRQSSGKSRESCRVCALGRHGLNLSESPQSNHIELMWVGPTTVKHMFQIVPLDFAVITLLSDKAHVIFFQTKRINVPGP